jgi:hypothetical protein
MRRSSLVSRFLVVWACIFVSFVATRTDAAGGSVRTLRAPDQRIQSFEPPSAWERAADPPSSLVLGVWSHRDGGRITLAADRVASGTVAGRVFDDSRKSLVSQGWSLGKVDRAPNGARVLVEATLEHGRRIARQAYIVDGGFVYVVTMVAPAEQTADRARDFEDTVATLKLGAVEKR